MEESLSKSFKNELEERDVLGEDRLPAVKSEQDSLSEEEQLKLNLDKLKKQNFILQASIKAWQTTLENKLQEFKMAELNLEEIHKEIWSEREKFCSKADEFSGAYGIFSDWWESQMKFVSDLETLQQKSSEDQECKEEIAKLEKEVEKLKSEINHLQGSKQITEVEVHATFDGQSACNSRKDETPPEATSTKKGRYSEEEEDIEICGDIPETANSIFYSMVDLEKDLYRKLRPVSDSGEYCSYKSVSGLATCCRILLQEMSMRFLGIEIYDLPTTLMNKAGK